MAYIDGVFVAGLGALLRSMGTVLMSAGISWGLGVRNLDVAFETWLSCRRRAVAKSAVKEPRERRTHRALCFARCPLRSD